MSNRDAVLQAGTFRAWCGGALASGAIALTACGGGDGQAADPSQTVQVIAGASDAALSTAYIGAVRAGFTPFNSFVDIVDTGNAYLAGAEFTISPKPGSVSKAVHVRYSIAALHREGRAFNANGLITLPIFGLYAGWPNQVSVQLDYLDGSASSLPVTITTPTYTDPSGIYDHPTILTPRAAGSALGFDFFVMKSTIGPLVIVDTDGEIRWIGAAYNSGLATALVAGGFVVGDPAQPALFRMGFDGSLNSSLIPSPPYTMFHHNIDYGKQGLLAEIDEEINVQSTLVELDANGSIEHQWELGDILSAYMSGQGDDPSQFVRPGTDWFHMNASTYDPRDDSIIVSSRENFLIKVDYATGDIIWILGDPTKYWYTFPSLRRKALTLQAGDLYPVGQHAVSITSDGLIMVFNDGFQSTNQPTGAPAGISRTYSAVSAYSVDPASGSAHEVWRFDYGQSIYSSVCGSAYEALASGSLLVDFATADNRTQARLVGLDGEHNVVFDFQYPSPQTCGAAWNAEPIALDNFSITSIDGLSPAPPVERAAGLH